MAAQVHFQLHGYRGGHQLLDSSIRLDAVDQDVVDHLSDMAGPLRPREEFSAYISGYPVPSGDYYAVARTEQDAEAPRAGCVRTRTLLVPMDYWETEADPVRTARLLERPIRRSAIDVGSDRSVGWMEPLEDPVVYELVEALFLEKRRAIVVFGTENAKEITLRLMAALWPAMRRRFSVCTFVLSPRTALGRSFDLVFAPRSARLRFSEWDGRRIDGPKKRVGDRHRWTGVLVARIFRDKHPHLADAESMKALVADGRSVTEGFLRLCLRWEELRDSVHRSPTALLGLVDIANSQKGERKAWDALERVVVQGVHNAVLVLEVEVAWQFVNGLLEKLIDRGVGVGISESVGKAGAILTARNWSIALKWLRREPWIEGVLGDEVLRGVGRTVASNEFAEVTRELNSIPPARLVRMALLEERFLGRLFASTDAEADAALMRSVADGYRTLDPETRERNMLRFLRRIQGNRDVELLREILVDATGTQIVNAVEVVWSSNSCRTGFVGDVLCSAAEISGSREEARATFAAFGSDTQTNRCISRLLTLSEQDVTWLLESSSLGNRRASFLNELIRDSSDREMERAFGGSEIARRALRCLIEDVCRFAGSAARLVRMPIVSEDDHISVGLKVFPLVGGEERRRLAHSMVISVLKEGWLHSAEVRKSVIRMAIRDVELSAVIDEVFSAERKGEEVDRTLAVVDDLRSSMNVPILKHIKHIVGLVASRRQFDLGPEGTEALAKLIDDTREVERRTFVEICSAILPFAMASRRESASRIVVAAFPTVYDELRDGRHLFWLGDFFDFFDWDRCKVARKRLVRAFMESDWPPVDLAIVADRARDLERILRRVLKEPKGRKYIVRIEESARDFEDRGVDRILSAIRGLLRQSK